MATTLDELERRLMQVEQVVARLQGLLEPVPHEETPAARGARLLREAALHQAEIASGWAKAMEQMGIQGEPVGAEKVQEMMAACGIQPEDNEFRRGILEMREE